MVLINVGSSLRLNEVEVIVHINHKTLWCEKVLPKSHCKR